MHPENYSFLQDRFTALGFDGTFDKLLKAEMTLGIPAFSVAAKDVTQDGNIMFEFNLAQSKNETSHPKDYYFLNSVKATLSKEGQENKVHTFMLYKQQGFHADKMKNLMTGRSVHEQFRKEGRNVEVWRRIDFGSLDQYQNTIMRPTYKNFDIEKELSKLPFIKIDQKEREMLVKALKDGNDISVNLKQGSNIEKMSLIAMPHLGVIHVFNGQGDKVSIANNQLRVIGKEESQSIPETTQKMMEAGQQQKPEGQQQQGQRRRAS